MVVGSLWPYFNAIVGLVLNGYCTVTLYSERLRGHGCFALLFSSTSRATFCSLRPLPTLPPASAWRWFGRRRDVTWRLPGVRFRFAIFILSLALLPPSGFIQHSGTFAFFSAASHAGSKRRRPGGFYHGAWLNEGSCSCLYIVFFIPSCC